MTASPPKERRLTDFAADNSASRASITRRAALRNAVHKLCGNAKTCEFQAAAQGLKISYTADVAVKPTGKAATVRTRKRSMPLMISDGRCQASGAMAVAGGVRSLLALPLVMAIACCCQAANAADDAPAPTADAPFQPEDISIGEPISLPFAPPLTPPTPATAPGSGPTQAPATQLPSVIAPAPRAATGTPAVSAPEAAVPPAATGNGWLGLAVDDTLVTGRLVVVEVAPDGPAAKAGVRPQDMLLAINGTPFRNGDELAAVLAAIAPDQRVKMALGRDNRVEDVVAQASTRPPEAVSRDWQSAGPQDAVPPVSAAASSVSPPAVQVPVQSAPASTAVGLLPAPSGAAPVAVPSPARLGSGPLPLGPLPLGPLPTPSRLATPASVPAFSSAPARSSAPAGRTALGVRTVPVDPTVQSRFRLSDSQGAFVIGVVQDLPASKAGVPPGSVIVAINHQPVRSPQDLTQLVTRGPVGTPVPIQYVLPGGQARQAEVVLQSLEQPLERALVGDSDADRTTQPPALQPTPQTARRVQPTAVHQSAGSEPLVRLEELLRRVNDRLDHIDRRLEALEAGGR
jgi:membrane-associated protease RseP (regulator of RpoE activity)